MTKVLGIAVVAGLATLPSFGEVEPSGISAAVAREVQSDAANRSWLGDASVLGNEGFELNIEGDMQFRYTANLGDNVDAGDDFEGGFSLPLTRLRFIGETNGFDFNIGAAFSESTGRASLENAYVGHEFGTWRAQAGQFRLPFMREVNVDSRYQLAADRSAVSGIFGQGRSQGVMGVFDFGNFRFSTAFSDGFSTANTDYVDPMEADVSFTGRLDWTAIGERNVFVDFTSDPSQNASLLLGAAGHYQDGDMGSLFTYTGDVSFEYNGWNAFGSGVGRNIEDDDGNDWFDFGGVAQGGYRFSNNVELFARYDIVVPDDDRDIEDSYNFITTGVNYYYMGHAARVTGDVVYSIDGTEGLDSMGDFSSTSLLAGQEEGTVALRLQFQLLF